MSKKKTLFLYDGNSFIHRAGNTMPAFNNKAGHPTGAIAGFLSMMTSVMNKFKPDKNIVNFDHKGKNFRHEMFPDYKGNRPPTEPDLAMQFQPIKDIVKAWGLPIISIPGYEADDSLATLAEIGVSLGYIVYIVTSDKDLRQRIRKDIYILDTQQDKNPKPLDADGVFDKMGVYPDRVIDLLAIMGDSSDNIPGAAGVGPVTAAKWLDKFDTLEGVIENIDTVKGAYAEKFRNQIAEVRLSYKLVTIDYNIDLGVDFNDIVGERDDEELYRLIQEYELKKFQLAIGAKNTNAEETTVSIINLDDNDSNEKFSSIISQAQIDKSLFIEHYIFENNLVLFLSNIEDESVYTVTINNDNKYIASLLMSYDITLSGNDMKNTLKALVNNLGTSLNTTRPVRDTRVLNFNMNGGSTKDVGIDVLNQLSANIELSELRVTNKLDMETAKWNKLNLEEIVLVKSQELVVAKKTFESDTYKEFAFNSKGMIKSLAMDFALLPVLAQMEIDGVYINKEKLDSIYVRMSEKLVDIEVKIFEMAGQKFNVNSSKDVIRVLFEDLEIPSKKKSSAEDVLSKLVEKYPIAGLILQWRSLSKMISTYVVGITKRLDSNGKVYATFNQNVTTSSRLSVKDPGLQSIPVASVDGKEIRESFEARAGYKYVALDYSQIEIRILAHLCQQPELVEAFLNGEDVHAITAAHVFNVNLEDVTPLQRRAAKAINFGLIYGKGAKAVAAELKISKKEAEVYIEGYFTKYDMIRPNMASILEFSQENLYVETEIGRKLLTRNVNTSNSMQRSHAELSAKNAPLQGTAADIVKQAMIDVAKYIYENKPLFDITLLMQVHDELVVEIKEEYAEEISKVIAGIMEDAVCLTVPLVVDYKVANNWADAH
jgi:DNA polymerase-1